MYMRMIGIVLGLMIFHVVYANTFTLTSSAYKNLQPIPVVYTCDGDNISPPLSWTQSPDKTQSFALILYNPDAPFGTYYNWVLYNIPKTIHLFPKGASLHLPDEIQVGKTSSGDMIYRGPCPPNAAIHHYIFKIFALDTTLDAIDNMDADVLLAKIKNHVLAEAELVGIYNH